MVLEWTTIGAVATAISAVAAFATITHTLVMYQREKNQSRADQIRQDLKAIINDSQSISTLLNDGSILIVNSSAITKEFHSRLGLAATSEDFWKYLNDEGLSLSFIVEGWDSSPQTARLMEIINHLNLTSTSLSGSLRIVSEATGLLDRIVHDSYSYNIFCNMLLEESPKVFFEENKNKHDIRELINALTVFLQANSALYFVVRYMDSIKEIDEFIKTISNELINLNNRQLIDASRTKSKQAITSPTISGGIKILLNDLKANFSKETYDTLLGLIEDIEKSISKEEADKKIRDFEGQKDKKSFKSKLKYLKSKGINDPNIDLFLGVVSGDENLVKSALGNGADIAITDSELIAKYKNDLKDFTDQ
ncbi:Uncharacterised protein [uncultured archaeon]|nr:Uncharacterised protein [uncultured archaeon]